MSLREVGLRVPGSHERGTRHRNRDESRDSRDEEARRQRRRDHERRRRDERPGEPSAVMDSRSQARQIEHQSSLRSLLSGSNVDSVEMEEEILRQIVEEGLLDGIDLDSLNVRQQDELSERIANAYRRRHGRHSRSENTRHEEPRELRTRTRRADSEQVQHRQHVRSTTDQSTHSSRPPVSRPHLLEAYPIGPEHRRRRSSDGRRQTSPVSSTPSVRASSEVRREAARSATDLSERPRTNVTRRTRPAALISQGRRTTDPDSHRLRDQFENPVQSPRTVEGVTATVSVDSPTRNTNSSPAIARTEPSFPTPNSEFPDQGAIAGASTAQRPPYPLGSPGSAPRASPSSSRFSLTQPLLYIEPVIECNRCNKPQLQYEIHQNCSSCREGTYNLCIRCYRLGLGCLHWYGFSNVALQRYEHQAPAGGYPPGHALPHILTGRRYLRPAIELQQSVSGKSSQLMTSENPAKRLQSGVFCSNCSAFANDCFWKCDFCNEGEWGFCNVCVNQGKCCIHPLLPLAHSLIHSKPHPSSSSQHTQTSFAPNPRPSSTSKISTLTFPAGPYTPLTFSTKCDICTYPIPPSSTRFHCPLCNDGDYDICTACYMRLVSTGRISSEKGHKGWRRCLKNHRMIVAGFQDSPTGQKRVVINDLVGGQALKDDLIAGSGSSDNDAVAAYEEWTWRDGAQVQVRTITKSHLPVPAPAAPEPSSSSTTKSPLLHQHAPPQHFPPDGGVGMKVLACWSYWPAEEGADNELTFPKGAVVVEAEDINRDWFWGVYAGRKGIFPGNYGMVLEVVGR